MFKSPLQIVVARETVGDNVVGCDIIGDTVGSMLLDIVSAFYLDLCWITGNIARCS